jgi:hypothetical protein
MSAYLDRQERLLRIKPQRHDVTGDMVCWNDSCPSYWAVEGVKRSHCACVAEAAGYCGEYYHLKFEDIESNLIKANAKIEELEDEVATLKRGNLDYAKRLRESEKMMAPVIPKSKYDEN